MKNSLLTTPNILFAALSAVFFAFAFRPLAPPVATTEESYEHHSYLPAAVGANALSARAQQYRQQLAVKLNRQRIETEYSATFSSRAENTGRSAVAHEDDLAFGVEAIRKRPSQDVPVDQNQPDMQIRADLIRQQWMAQQSSHAREQFISQYIANARAEGYTVKVDRDYNVEITRGPNVDDGRGPQSISDSDADLNGPQKGLIEAAFIYAPFCH